MHTLEFLAWLFWAVDEDGQLPVLFGTLIEAALAVIVAVTVHRLTDIRDVTRRLDRLEDAGAHNAIAFERIADRVEEIEEKLDEDEAE